MNTVNHYKLVFADEKPLREKDLYDRVRRDPLNGTVPDIIYKGANNKRIRYNVLAAVSLTKRNPFCTRVIEEYGDAIVFSSFVGECIREGVLQPYDIFVVDNCSIHFKGENEPLQQMLWEEYAITMIPLPPYHAELNPTELVFRSLLKRVRALRCSDISDFDFLTAVREELSHMSYRLAKSFFRECGYAKRNRE